MSDSPVRAALLTPAAPGAIAVISIEGPSAFARISGLLQFGGGRERPILPESRPMLCRIMDGEAALDDALVVRFERDGLETIELSTHGGVRIAERVLALLASVGVEIVDSSALQSGSTIERDVDSALMNAASRRMVYWLLRQREILPAFLKRAALASASERFDYEIRARAACRLISGIHLAIIGPPNAGKSTLANRMIGRDRIIVSDAAGTTRDWVAETALVSGWPVTLIDTAGVRETQDPIEIEAIQRGHDRTRSADLVLIVLDATLQDARLAAQLREMVTRAGTERPSIVVLNKCDALVGCSPIEAPAFGDSIRVSAKTSTGIAELEAAIEKALGLDLLADECPTGFLPSHLAAAETS